MSARRDIARTLWGVGVLALGCANTASGVSGTGRDAGVIPDVIRDAQAEDRPPPPPPPAFRLRSPISNHAIGTSRPILRWFSPQADAEHVVTICADRACETVQDRQTVRALTAQPTRDLPLGLHYWFVSTTVNGAAVRTPTWLFRTTWETDGEPRTDDRGSAADFNGDGYSDVAVLYRERPHLRVIYGGNGELSITPAPTGPSSDEPIVKLCGAADFNGDGFDDLAVWTSSGESYVSGILLGAAEGLSGLRRMPDSPTTPVALRAFSARHALRRGDLDQDGYEDLVDTDRVYRQQANRMRVIWGGSSEVFWQRLDDNEDDGAVIFDINQDGIPDLLSMGLDLVHGVRMSMGPLDRSGRWVYSSRRDVSDVTLCDLDHDRSPDVVGASMMGHHERYGIAGWLRSSGRSETPLPLLPGRIWGMGCLSSSGADRLIYTPYITISLSEATLYRASDAASPRLVEARLILPEPPSLATLYAPVPTGSFMIDQHTQHIMIISSGYSGTFVNVMSLPSEGHAVTIRTSIRLASDNSIVPDYLH